MIAQESSALKKTYDAIALFAVLNLLTLAGGMGYLMASGVVTGDRLRGLIEYFETIEAPEPEEETTDAPVEDATDDDPKNALATLPSNMSTEIMRREAERIKAELDQRLALNNGILLRITEERDAFRRERDAEAARKLAEKQKQETVGFDKQVEIIGSLSPKVAVNHLLEMSNLEDAARVLNQLDTRKAKRIVEAAKTPDQMQKMRNVLQKLKEVAPERKDLAQE